MDMKLTLKKNRKFKKKTISSKAKKRDIYSENAIMPIGKMVGGAVSLNWNYIPRGAYLQKSMQGAITKYPKLGNWIDYLPSSNNLIDVNSGTYTLKSLKAVDAVKDGAPVSLADRCFDTFPNPIEGSGKNPSTLKAFVKDLFDKLVESKELKYIQYTRIKNKIVPAPELPGVHYDYYIPDCGPTYSEGNGKTPEVLTSAGGYPQAIYSLGNNLDTGPSSSKPINLHCKPRAAYTIDKITMEVLGYNNLQIEVKNTNPIDYKIWFSDPKNPKSIPVTPTDIGDYAVGNANKNLETNTKIGIDEKKKYLFIKSLGDTLIVYHWLWACLSTSPDKKISLLTCDSVVALQAFILGHTNVREAPFLQNAQFALNYTEKGEHHISKVYYKGQPPNYAVLFDSEKNKIIQRYHAEIYNFENFIKNNGFTFGENRTYKRPNLIGAIIVGLIAQIDVITGFRYSTPEHYKTLKGYELTPLIRSKINEQFVLIRGRNKFSVNDTTFLGLGPKYKPMTLEYLVTNNIFEDDTTLDEINGGSVSNNTSKIIGGRNDDDIEGEHFYKIGLDKANEQAILNLQKVIDDIYSNILFCYNVVILK